MANTKKKSDSHIKQELLGITLLALSLIMLVSVISPNSEPLFHGDGAGTIGSFIARVLGALTGNGKYFIPFIVGLCGCKLLLGKKNNFFNDKMPGVIILSLTVLTAFHLRTTADLWNFSAGFQGEGGGIIGVALLLGLTYLFGYTGSVIVLTAFFFVGIILITKISLSQQIISWGNLLKNKYQSLRNKIIDFIYVPVNNTNETKTDHEENWNKEFKVETDEEVMFNCNLPLQEEQDFKQVINKEELEEDNNKDVTAENGKEDNVHQFIKDLNSNDNVNFTLPPFNILQKNLQLKSIRMEKDITEKVKLLEETLESFGIQVKVNQVSKGPAITRFEMQPAPGVKVSKIVNLADDIALALAASSVRIEAPIPGKAAVGIEIPNKEVSVVTFREVLETKEFQQSKSKLSVALGKDVAGKPIIADLQTMPHLLIAGATGSGKSVCMNTVIASLLYKATPLELKLLMIDPKMVELTNYNGIPHLISPVVTDSKKAAVSLKWVVEEMENRYDLFAKNGVKDITRYNNIKTTEKDQNALIPYIVVLIDELADLMMVAPLEVEDSICRLAQMARAAGIHLVVATQRPSVDVITGLIKANIPSRIAFAVSSQTDSRTILDMGGAEKLLGRGDMLYYPTGAAKPQRVQGCFLSDEEVENVVTFLKNQGEPDYLKGIIDTQESVQKAETVEESDPLFFDAAKLVIEQGQASISMLQRRLHIGYNRAARLVDMLEERSIIGGYEGNKPRNIIMTREELDVLLDNADLRQEETQ